MNKKHPGMVIFYVIVIGAAEYFYLFYAVPKLHSVERRVFAWLLIIASEVTFLVACISNPGIVTPLHLRADQAHAFESVEAKFQTAQDAASRRKLRSRFLLSPEEELRQARRYVVDNILYAIATQQSQQGPPNEKPMPPPHGTTCASCETARPARSKHCRLCGHCVRRFDHHCPWINNDVAENNHRYFLLFLFSHVISCYWAAFDCYTIIMQMINGQKLLSAMFVNGAGRRVRATASHVALYLMNQETSVCCVLLFTVLIGTLLLGFWGYQMRMVLNNVTSNDLNKIDDVMEFLQRQPTAVDVQREALQLSQYMLQWTGRKVVIPPLPDVLKDVAAKVQTPTGGDASGKDEPSRRAAAMASAAATPLTEAQKKASRAYRKEVEKVLSKALKLTFCAGSYAANLREVLFPYRESKYHRQWRNELAPGAARKEKIFGGFRGDQTSAFANGVNSQRPLPGEERTKGSSKKKS
jgi:hypothetical protein